MSIMRNLAKNIMIFYFVFQSLYSLNAFDEVSKYRDIVYRDVEISPVTVILPQKQIKKGKNCDSYADIKFGIRLHFHTIRFPLSIYGYIKHLAMSQKKNEKGSFTMIMNINICI